MATGCPRNSFWPRAGSAASLMRPLSYGTARAASTGLGHFVRRGAGRAHHRPAALAAGVVADRAGEHAKAEPREERDRRRVVLRDGEGQELAPARGVGDDGAEEGGAEATPKVGRYHGDRDEI